MNKNNISLIEKELKNKKIKMLAILAPSFVAEFDYPIILSQLKELGFDKVVELTFGAKMINREYHKQLESYKNKKEKKLIISSACAGIQETIPNKFPKLRNNLINIDSPMIATAKICKKIYPTHKLVFISPCQFKKIEAQKSKYLDYVIDYQQLKQILSKNKLKDNKTKNKNNKKWDKFYNDYTKVYPLSGGLSKTAHLKGAIKKSECKVIDGIKRVEQFLKKPERNIRFLDVTFCKGGCIGGPCLSNNLTLAQKKKRILDYMKLAEKEDIPNQNLGIIKRAEGIKFMK